MKRVLITGGTRGIGLAACKKFLERGEEVVVIGRDVSSFALKDATTAISFDLTQIEKIPELLSRIGHVDILINNAGIMNSIPYDAYPEDKKQAILKINLEAPIALITECSKSMIEKDGGRIVNLTSIAGSVGHPDIWYGMTKAALINATKIFGKILGAHNIMVTSVAPGPVETDMIHQIPDERLKDLRARTSNGVFATAEEIADIIVWLATDASFQINGSTIDANNCAYPR